MNEKNEFNQNANSKQCQHEQLSLVSDSVSVWRSVDARTGLNRLRSQSSDKTFWPLKWNFWLLLFRPTAFWTVYKFSTVVAIFRQVMYIDRNIATAWTYEAAQPLKSKMDILQEMHKRNMLYWHWINFGFHMKELLVTPE